ncbi:MAG: metallophosphoesterase family protein [Rhodospirillales bacterium]|jgi:predicted phosphodiesterase|nr:metallophosphoesterase family protein [Rhodospirillales bacterium]
MTAGPLLDLGSFDGPILVFGGPYGNLEATQAVLAEAGRLGIPASHMLCTGDVCAYCADPQGVVDLLRETGIVTVMGNCEESLAEDGADCGCGFASGSACDVLARQWFGYAAAHLDAGAKAWMRNLPRQLSFRLAGHSFRVIHGGAERINRFIFGSASDNDIAGELNGLGVDAVIAGHCGLPFSRVVDGRLWHNAGVIGMPANDGTPRGWYSVLRQDGVEVAVDHRSFGYDHAAQACKMREHGLPEAYARALETGLWPNLDILPPAERERTGRAVVAGSLRWRGHGKFVATRRGRRQVDLRIT